MMRKLFWLVAVVAIVALLNRESQPPAPDPRLAQLSAFIEQGQADQAYDEIQRLLPQLAEHELRQQLYRQRAAIEVGRRHYHYALESYHLAQRVGDNSSDTRDKIKGLKAWIAKMQDERNMAQSYRDARNNGIAGQLKGEVTILYLYLNDNRWSRWSNKERLQNRQYLQQVTGWYQRRAQEYGLEKPQFNSRFFYLTAPKGISKEWLRSKRFFADAQQLVSRQLGYRSMEAFIRDKAPTGEVALVFHSNGEARSFALSCRNKQASPRCRYEYVMLTEKVMPGATHTFIPQVQAHEILHLFGAADLYRIRQARDYAVTDIMNYYSDTLGHATIEPITAWSIGWAKAPDAPFQIENKEK